MGGTTSKNEMARPDSALYSTNGEYGLKVLAAPSKAAIDILFVHGLTGNRESTWTDDSTHKFWLRDFLPQDLPNARIITFGYDADIVRAIDIASCSTVRDHGKALATELGRFRLLENCEDRPLIFVAHSLGGLVVEQALLISRGAAEAWMNTVLECTKGILFMSTPHAGSNLADWASILTNISSLARPTNVSLVSVLRPGSEMLASLQQEFHVLLNARQSQSKSVPRIYCFFEELAYNGMVRHVVPSHSAILTSYGNQGIHANHVQMTRFKGKTDKGYLDVSGQLRIWAREVEEQARSAEARNSNINEVRERFVSKFGELRGGERLRLYAGAVRSNSGPIIQGDVVSSGDVNLNSRR